MAGASTSTLSGAFVNVDLRDRTAAALSRTMRRMQNFANGISRIGRQIATVSFFPALGMFRAASEFANFEESLLAMQAASKEAGGVSFDQVEKKIRSLGQTTSFTAQQVAEASFNLGRGGFNTSQIEGSLDDVLNLGRAARAELPLVAQTMIETMNSFGISGRDDGFTQSTRAADVMTFAVNRSSQGLEELRENLKLVGTIAGDSGIRLEEAAAAAMVMADVGIQGTLGGTAIRRAVANLSGDVDGARTKLEGMGVAVRGRNIMGVLEDFARATASMSQDDRMAKAFDILGIRGIFAKKIFEDIGKATPKYEEFLDALDKTKDTAKDAAAHIDSGLKGAILKTISVLNEFQLALGQAFQEDLEKFLQWLRTATTEVIAWAKENKAVVVTIAKVTAGAFGFGLSLVGVAAIMQTVIFTFGSLTAAILLTGSAIFSLQFAMVALPTIFFLHGYGEQAKAGAASIKEALAGVTIGLEEFRKAIAAGELTNAFEIMSITIKAIWESMLEEMKWQWDEFVSHVWTRFGDLLGKNAISHLIDGLGASEMSPGGEIGMDPDDQESLPEAMQSDVYKSREALRAKFEQIWDKAKRDIATAAEVITVEQEEIIIDEPKKADVLAEFQRDRDRKAAIGDIEAWAERQRRINKMQEDIDKTDAEMMNRTQEFLGLRNRTEGLFSTSNLARRFAFSDRKAGADPTIAKLEEQKKLQQEQLAALEKIHDELSKKPLPSQEAADFIFNKFF